MSIMIPCCNAHAYMKFAKKNFAPQAKNATVRNIITINKYNVGMKSLDRAIIVSDTLKTEKSPSFNSQVRVPVPVPVPVPFPFPFPAPAPAPAPAPDSGFRIPAIPYAQVKRSALISDIEDGGLKAPHLNSLIETQRILCYKKLAIYQPSGWKTILLHYLKPAGGKLVLCCDFDLKKLPMKLPAFYEECIKFFAKRSAVNNLNIQDLNGQDLSKVIRWNNKFSRIGDKSVYVRNLAEKGILLE